MTKWKNYKFQSSSGKTPEFLDFAKDVKKFIKCLPAGIVLDTYTTGHFYISGFLKRNNEYIYFNTGDVRWNGSPLNMYYRTAKDNKDYTGGINHSTDIITFVSTMNTIFERSYSRLKAIKKEFHWIV